MVDVPEATPVTTPLVEFTVATEVVALLHVPPDTELANVVVDPTHTVAVPVMDPGVVHGASTCAHRVSHRFEYELASCIVQKSSELVGSRQVPE